MSEMSAALAADNFGSTHSVAAVFLCFDIFFVDWLVKARPSGSRLVFCGRVEQFITAGYAFVYARFFCFVVFASKGTLRAFHSADLVLLGRELFFPFFI